MENRYIAHITIETDTPLKVGSNASDFLQDSPVQKDWNGLPMILGTSIAGVLRKHYRDVYNNDDIFGFQREKSDDGEGSKVIFSNALLLDENKKVNEGLLSTKSKFLEIFDNLPIREHTAITDKGVALEHSKFDEEVVYKGTQFKFSIEMIEDKKDSFNKILSLLQSISFRLGGGSTKGFGKFRVLSIATVILDSIDTFVAYSSSLNSDLSKLGSDGFSLVEFRAKASDSEQKTIKAKNHTTYTLKITPDNFFMFGSGFGDSDADNTPVYEQVVDYQNAKLSNKQILIPASSIKGALSHRTTYHYNLQNKFFIGDSEAKTTIKELFGEAKNSKDNIDGAKGKILISDCFEKEEKKDSTKTFDHVSIDRFTGGAIEGALFQEKTIAQKDEWEIEILLENKDIEERYIKAFESALKDICTGMLSLGGMTTKGHGMFSGIVLKDGNEL